MTTISAVVLSWDRRDDTMAAVASLVSQLEDGDEVVVVDAASSDGSAQAVREAYPAVRVVELDRNYGVPGNRNRGVEHAIGDVVLFLDNDAELLPGGLGEVRRIMRDHPHVAIVAGQVVRYGTDDLDEGCWVYPFPAEEVRGQAFLTHNFTGGACAVRAAVFSELGPWWEELFFAREEEDLAFRVLNRGWQIVYAPSIRVGHKTASQRKTTPPEKLALDLRNALMVDWSYLPLPMCLATSVGRVGIYLARSLRARRPSVVPSALRGAWSQREAVRARRDPIGPTAVKEYRMLNPQVRPMARSPRPRFVQL